MESEELIERSTSVNSNLPTEREHDSETRTNERQMTGTDSAMSQSQSSSEYHTIGERLGQSNGKILVDVIGATDLRHPIDDSRNVKPFVQVKYLQQIHDDKTEDSNIGTDSVKDCETNNNPPPLSSPPLFFKRLQWGRKKQRSCKMKLLHKTKFVKNNHNPVWTVDHHCFFILNCPTHFFVDRQHNSEDTHHRNDNAVEFDLDYASIQTNTTNTMIFGEPESLLIEVRTHDSPFPNQCSLLGSTILYMDDIVNNCNEERLELTLTPPSSSSDIASAARNVDAEEKEQHQQEVDNKKKSIAVDQESVADDDKTEFDSFVQEAQYQASLQQKENKQQQSKRQKKNSNPSPGMQLALRFRPATTVDQTFVTKLALSEHLSSPTFRGQNTLRRPLATRLTETTTTKSIKKTFTWNRKTKYDPITKTTLFRVYPYSDPTRPEQTTFLSKEELKEEMVKKSNNWTESRSKETNALGKIFLEILRCDNLPNLDVGPGNYTDAFVTAIYEDNLVQTDVIDDSLSPLWMPWTKRAFTFFMTHSLSPLFLSVFDYDAFGLGENTEAIGQVAINLNHFDANVTYTLQYGLHEASNMTERETRGTLTIRIRKEIYDERALLLHSLKPQPNNRFHINMQQFQTFTVANFTTNGKYCDDNFHPELIKSRISEIHEHFDSLFNAISDGFSSLIMWKGQVRIQIGSSSSAPKFIYLPLHSACSFFGGLYLLDRPHLLPSSFFLGMAWILLMNMHNRSQHPSPWYRTVSFQQYISVLLFGKRPQTFYDIKEDDGYRESVILEVAKLKRNQMDQDRREKMFELQQQLDQMGNTDLHTNVDRSKETPMAKVMAKLAPSLFSLQKKLGVYCDKLEYIKAILIWEENLLSFWICLACLITGIVLLIIPTTFLLYWTIKLTLFLVFGPWFRLYTELRRHHHTYDAKVENETKKMKLFDPIMKRFEEEKKTARVNNENAEKRKAIRILRFGDLIAKIPATHYTRHYDYPLRKSTASGILGEPGEKILPVTEDLFEKRKFLLSQRMGDGIMIPLVEREKANDSISTVKKDYDDGPGDHPNIVDPLDKLTAHALDEDDIYQFVQMLAFQGGNVRRENKKND